MQAAVERVLRNFTLRQPMPDEAADATQDDATRFAGQLLQNYRAQLEQRSRTDHQRKA